MKAKNLLILGGLAFLVYQITKKNNDIASNPVDDMDSGDKDLADVNDGNEPQSLGEDEKTKLFNKAQISYRGGARPTEELLNRYKQMRDEALAKIKELGLHEEYKLWRKEKAIMEKQAKVPDAPYMPHDLNLDNMFGRFKTPPMELYGMRKG